jgi:Zn-dependent protease
MRPRRPGFVAGPGQMNPMTLLLFGLLAMNIFTARPTRTTEDIVAYLAAFIIAIAIHEFFHAYVAHRLGDDTAKNLGRITLNPISHFDPFGFFGMVMIAIGYPFIGWGKPVPVNPARFTSKRVPRQRGLAVVALAGPVSNVVQALLVAVPLRLSGRELDTSSGLDRFLAIYVTVNLLLAAFNMIPVPPLDGSKVLLGLVPRFWYPVFEPLEKYGFIILLALLFIGGNIGDEIVSGMIDPVYSLLARIVLGADLRL